MAYVSYAFEFSEDASLEHLGAVERNKGIGLDKIEGSYTCSGNAFHDPYSFDLGTYEGAAHCNYDEFIVLVEIFHAI